MKKLIVLAVLFFLIYSIAFGKEAKQFDSKFNPSVNISKLDLKKVTIYEFENTAGEGQVILDTLYEELLDVLKNGGLEATIFKLNIPEVIKDEFALSSPEKPKDTGNIYNSSPTDIVISGNLVRLSYQMKDRGIFSKDYYTVAIELFVYSKLLNTVIYKASDVRILKIKGSLKSRNKHARRTVFRACLEEILEPFFNKVKNPDMQTP